MKIHIVGAKLFHAEGQRDMMRLIVTFAISQTIKNTDWLGGLKTGLQNWI